MVWACGDDRGNGTVTELMKKRMLGTIESDMRDAGVCIGNVEYRQNGRSRTRVADPKYLGRIWRRKKRGLPISMMCRHFKKLKVF